MGTDYDEIGRGYAQLRVPDERIAQPIEEALGGSRSVANIGAGTGSYEPMNRKVVALEPSVRMLHQYEGGGTAVRAVAESLPLESDSVDAAMTVLSIHHWQDWRRGLAEMRRVARDVVVVLTYEPGAHDFWLSHYFPDFRELDRKSFLPLRVLEAETRSGRWEIEVIPVPVPHDCTDGFCGAYWRRPEAYLRAEVRRSISTFHMLDEDVVKTSLARLRQDLDSGAWDRQYGPLRSLEQLDLGYRVLKMTPE